MRRTVTLIVLFLITVLTAMPTHAQERPRPFEPKIIRVDLANKEPPTFSVASQVAFTGSVEGCVPPPGSTSPYFCGTPGAKSFPGVQINLTACRYASQPTAVLTDPFGNKRNFTPTNAGNTCWKFQVLDWRYGTLLGGYSFTVSGAEGTITTSWEAVAHPPRRGVGRLRVDEDTRQPTMPMLLGYEPQEKVTLYFFINKEPNKGVFKTAAVEFVATRTVIMDNDGAAVIDARFSRSSPLRNQVVFFAFDSASDLDPEQVLVDADRYPSQIVYPRIEAASPAATTGCPNSPPPRLVKGKKGIVTPGDPNALRPQPFAGDNITEIPAGDTFTVLDGPVCDNVKGYTWWKVDYNGQVGWTAEGEGNTYWLAPVN